MMMRMLEFQFGCWIECSGNGIKNFFYTCSQYTYDTWFAILNSSGN